MCGISGKIRQNEAVSEAEIMQMLDTIIHRGPDDYGVYVKTNVGIGMRRLAIIDVISGQQPMFEEINETAIVFNGEIYNFKEIRDELEVVGCSFETNSDTEVILKAYVKWGKEFVHKLNGMFAIALWDGINQTLLLYRDRIGVKPLYYYQDSEQFLFGSEIKCLLTDSHIKKKLNFQALSLYLAYGYIPYPHSAVEGVYKLPPGHYLEFKNGEIKLTRYWDLKCDIRNGSISDLKEEFLALFEDAVKKRMISDVPLGAFLSGGIDSSAVVAMMAKNSYKPIKTFSIGFKTETEFDESRYAEEVAKLFKTDHTTFHVGPEIVKLMDMFITHFDEPFADYAAFPTYVVSKLARQHVTVVLTGDGGDELFAGYDRYLNEKLSDRLKNLNIHLWANPLVQMVVPLKYLFPINSNKRIAIERALQRWKEIGLDAKQRYLNRNRIFSKEEVKRLLKKQGDTDTDLLMGPFWPEGKDALASRLLFDIKTLLPEDMMTKVDRVSMAVSLEARSPFVDYRVAEFAAGLPSKYKLRGTQLKHFLKYSFSEILPHHILHRKKQGFATPLDKWLRMDLKKLVNDTLSPNKLKKYDFLCQDTIQLWVWEHYAEKKNNGHKLFMIMVLILWMQKYEIIAE
jgi:asparagine synthase (glutamine-hydrolysing)